MKDSQNTLLKLTERDAIHLHDIKINLNLAYRISNEIYRRKIFRIFKGKPFFPFQMLAILVGSAQASSHYGKLAKIWDQLYPDGRFHKTTYRKWTRRLMTYIIEFFFEVTIFLPNHSAATVRNFIILHGENHLFSALKKGRGVIVPGLHLGHFFHAVGALRFQTFKTGINSELIKISMIGTPENEFLMRSQAEDYPNIFPIITGPAQNLKKTISDHLDANHMVFFLQDYSNPGQMRVPFIHGTHHYQFLVSTPQMLTTQYFKHKSPIVPILTVPGKDLRYSHVYILPEIDPMKIDPSKEKSVALRQDIINFQNGNLTLKQKRGLVSLLVNRKINPFLLKYPFFWEEVFSFESRNLLTFNITISDDGKKIMQQLCYIAKSFINQSYEPEREDELLLQSIERIESQAKNILYPWIVSKRSIPTTLDFAFKSGLQVFDQLISIMDQSIEVLNRSERNKFKQFLLQLRQNFHSKH